jgi:hypothetical protein
LHNGFKRQNGEKRVILQKYLQKTNFEGTVKKNASFAIAEHPIGEGRPPCDALLAGKPPSRQGLILNHFKKTLNPMFFPFFLHISGYRKYPSCRTCRERFIEHRAIASIGVRFGDRQNHEGRIRIFPTAFRQDSLGKPLSSR